MSAPRFLLRVTCVLALGFAGESPRALQAKAERSSNRPVIQLVSEPRELPPLLIPPFVPPVNEPLVNAGVPLLARPWVQTHLVGGGNALETTWHLSVINGGSPRGPNVERPTSNSGPAASPAWPAAPLNRGSWSFANSETSPAAMVTSSFGTPGGIPVCGDFNGDGRTELGLFVAGTWYLDTNGNGRWDEGDLWVRLGSAGDQPVTGDWDGDGKTDLGIFGRAWRGDAAALTSESGLPDADNSRRGACKNAQPGLASLGNWRLLQHTAKGRTRVDAVDHVFQFGSSGDRVVVGDWNGDGIDTVGVFRRGHWVLDIDGDGRFTSQDVTFELGSADALPVAGDFNQDGVDEVGIFERGVWRLDTNGDRVLDERDRTVRFGQPGDVPLVGDFRGQGQDSLSVFRSLPVQGQRLSAQR